MPAFQALVLIQQILINRSTSSSTYRHTRTGTNKRANNGTGKTSHSSTCRAGKCKGCFCTNFGTSGCTRSRTKIPGRPASYRTHTCASLATIIAHTNIAGTTFRTLMSYDKSP